MMSKKLSIIIVNYNVTSLLRACLHSIFKFCNDIQLEVIVIDNASTDNSWKTLENEFSQVKFISSIKNLGFSKANNLAVESAIGEYLLFLNPDTEILDSYLPELLEFADKKNSFGCLGVRMQDANGCFLPECKRAVPDMYNSFEKLFTNFKPKNAKSYYRNDIDENEIAEVAVITGAFLLIKKDVYKKIGGFDEAYFMYGEDIDLCYTLLKNGYKNYYFGKATLLHHKGESTIKDHVYLERFYGAMEIYINKYYKKEKPIAHFFMKNGLKIRHLLEKRKL